MLFPIIKGWKVRVCNLRPREHITAALRELHWLPIRQRITFKLCLTMHNVHVGHSPRLICETEKPITAMANRSRLRSSMGSDYELQVIRHKLRERAFSQARPAAWNGLLTEIRSITDTSIFKSRLKPTCLTLRTTKWRNRNTLELIN